MIKVVGAGSFVGLAGCTSSRAGDGGSGGTVGGGGDSKWGDFSGETLHFVTGESDDASQEFWDRVTQDFAAETGADIKVEYTGFGSAQIQRIAQLVQAGEAPTVNQTAFHQVATFVENDILVPLTDVMDDQVAPAIGNPNDASRFEFEGDLYQIPFWNNVGDFFYREDLADEVGMGAPDTWDKVLEYAEKVDGIRPGLNGSYVAAGQGAHAVAQLASWLYNNDGRIVERDSSGDLRIAIQDGKMRDRFVETLEFQRDLHEFSPEASDSTWDTLASSMAQNTAACQWYVGFRPPVRSFRAEQDFAEHVRCLQHPTSPAGSRTGRGGADGLSVFRNSNEEMGKQFIAFMMRPKYLLDLYMSIAPVHNIPAYPDFQQSDDYQEALKDLPYNQEDIAEYQERVANDWISYPAETEPPNPYIGAVFERSPLWDMQTEVLVNDTDIDVAIDQYAPKMQANLDETAGQ
ncbi:extracellular solute-binding protein (plasmid) [Halorarum halophilum]|uniref:Extracellular solute-binding protein n=1 Tax=Halorarum halophilum TaxID=2743090 RepID=A0A7D5GEN9_9EURY|nr:extracellular solute-binding protein [Halobaculum halophilum]QLG29912.1 extracellular solute-binding protein [Halobaculum halophilum]